MLLQSFYEGIDAVQLVWNIDALRAVRAALVTADAVTRLSQLRHRAVVAHKERTAGTAIVIIGVIIGFITVMVV